MKYLLLLLLLFLCKCSKSQNPNYDSLRKYSYAIVGSAVNKDSIRGYYAGTCFFIKKNNRLFLVTAEHVLSSCHMVDNKNDYPKYMNITIENSKGEIIESLPINISTIKDTAHCPDPLNHPDIIALEVKKNDKLYSVEKFLTSSFKNWDNIEMFGFPNTCLNVSNPNNIIITKASNVYIKRQNTTIYNTAPTNDIGVYDSTYFFIVNKDLVVDSLMHGFSGAPIFIKESHSNKFGIIGAFSIFGYDRVNQELKYFKVPKIKYALDEINTLLY
jgi:hypothetical protein